MSAPPVVYLDHGATSPLRPEALAAMLPLLAGDGYGNPTGAHRLARQARRVIEDGRDQMAELLGVEPGEVVFTSGGTEAANLAIAGVAAARPGPVACSAAEHHAVLHAVRARSGAEVPVRRDGRLDLDALATLDPATALLSVMLANNETGAVQALPEVRDALTRAAPGAVLHTDAVAAFCWLDVAAEARPAELVSVSAHKFGGPKGTGALAVRAGVDVHPLLHGGGQERERRSGTHDVAGIAGMAAAAAAAARDRDREVARIGRLRDELGGRIAAALPGVTRTLPAERTTAGTLHVLVDGVESEALVLLLDGERVAASAGASCASGALEASHVLTAMGIRRPEPAGALRLTLGWSSSAADVEAGAAAVVKCVERLRAVA